MTDFQRRIVDFLERKALNGQADCWTIAQYVFPEKWARKSGRGALTGHIDRAGTKLVKLGVLACRLTPKTQFDSAVFCAWDKNRTRA